MSLRHAFPDVKLPELRKASEPAVAVPAMRKPSEVKFRSGRDMKEIAAAMVGKHVVRVVAAVGAGKSTLLPRELVLSTGAPLLHVVPSRLLAVAQYDWLKKKYSDMEYVLSLDGTEDYSSSGITITTAAAVWARLLRLVGSDRPLGEVTLFMDESHESDAYTYALHKLAHSVNGVKGVVFASANHDPSHLPMRETEGQVTSEKYSPKDHPKSWDPHDVGKPWAMSSFNGSVLMFVEPNAVANKLVAAYAGAGATAYRLTAKMDVSAFRRAYADCMNPGSGIVVLVADYSFRSGFTFDVATIIDSGMIAYEEVEGSKQGLSYRKAYEIERYQAQGRGGRTAGSSCMCYFPDIEVEASLCNLEFVEMDAAAVLFRLMGYAVPSQLRSSKFANGKVPRDLCYSLNDTTALACQSDTLMHELVYVSDEAVEQEHVDDLLDVVNSYSKSGSPLPVMFDTLKVVDPADIRTRMADAHSLLESLTDVTSGAASIEPPNYYLVPGLICDITTTRLYGSNVKNMVEELTNNPDAIKGFQRSDLKEIVAMLLNEYNMLNASVVGSSFAANHDEDLKQALRSYPSLVSNWATQLQQKIRLGQAKLTVYASLLNDLKPPNMHYSMVQPFTEMEDKVAKAMASQLISAIEATSRKLDSSGYQDSMLKRVTAPGFRQLDEDSLHMEVGDMQTARATMYPCRRGAKGTWSITVNPSDSDRWGEEDFVEACNDILRKSGTASRSVSALDLPGYISERKRDRILERVRGGKIHRSSRQFLIGHSS